MSRDWTHLTLREMTWGERAQAAFGFGLACVFGLVLFVGGIIAFGLMIEGITLSKVEHDRCLRKATNGYEIKECG